MRKRSISVLCVDADSFGLEVRRMVLESFGCKVTTCSQGDVALNKFAEQNFDVVLLDFNLERMHGDELAREIKIIRPNTPVLMLSNLIYPPESALPYIDGFATKGDSPRTLMAMIEKGLRASRRHELRPERALWMGGLAVTGAAWLVSKIIDRGKNRERESNNDPEADTPPPQKSIAAVRVMHV